MARIDQINLHASLLQNLEHWYPIHSRRLHHHALDPVLAQPIRHLFDILGKAVETANRFGVFVRTDRHPMLPAANVDAGRMRMHYL